MLLTLALVFPTTHAAWGNVDCTTGADCTTPGPCQQLPATCDSGVCNYTLKSCDDNNACTTDFCDFATGNPAAQGTGEIGTYAQDTVDYDDFCVPATIVVGEGQAACLDLGEQ